ncbi:MAG: tungsten formylmethanofuran dehydrogenase [Acidimicrobiaceae bacterium]|nr:tungsten formylmethanofuran dehydrogenase [Acidimicrobiaceae bacterium]
MGIFKKSATKEEQTTAPAAGESSTVRVRPKHAEVGLTDAQMIEIYKQMMLSRVVDQKCLALNRMGKAPFMVPASGHEATQVAAANAIVVGKDVVAPYYRDLGLVLSMGITPYEIFLGLFGKDEDPSSGGRQMPSHWGDERFKILTGSSPIATHLPHAVGAALDIKLGEKGGVVLASFGDGATSKGDFHEALNFAGVHKLPIIFLCENNGYAISVPLSKESAVQDLYIRAASYGFPGEAVNGNDPLAVFDAVSRAWARARAGEGPTLIEAHCYRFLPHTSDDDDKSYRDQAEVEAAKRNDPLVVTRNYLEAIGLITAEQTDLWLGQIKEQVDLDVAKAEEALDPKPDSSYDYVYAYHEQPKEGEVIPEESDVVSYIDALRKTQRQLLIDDHQVMVIGEDVGLRGGVFRATEGLLAEFGEDRVMDSPLAESSLVGIGIGLAMVGRRPIVEIQFADFIHSAFDQIVSEAARVHYRSKGTFDVPMVIRTPYGGGVHGALYHSQCIEAFYAHVPGLKVVAPSTPSDLAGLLRSAVEDPNPVLFLEHKKAYRLVKGLLPRALDHRVPIGKARIARRGRDMTIITFGLMVHYAERAAETIKDDLGAEVEVVDLRTISPLDREAILDSAVRCSKVLVVHEDNISFGVGAEVCAIIAEEAFWALDAPIARLAMADVPAMGYAKNIENELSISADKIVKAASELLSI